MNNIPTSSPPGSIEKINIMRQRAELGLPIFHQHDRADYSGIKGGHVTTKTRREARLGKVCPMVVFPRKHLSE